jgi:hypothetical protein
MEAVTGDHSFLKIVTIEKMKPAMSPPIIQGRAACGVCDWAIHQRPGRGAGDAEE